MIWETYLYNFGSMKRSRGRRSDERRSLKGAGDRVNESVTGAGDLHDSVHIASL